MTSRPIAGGGAMAELVDIIGEDAARQLARRFGGTSVYVPRFPGEHHPLTVALGHPAADKIAAWAGGSTLAVPKAPERRERVIDLHRRRALTNAQIATETGYSERHVYRLLREEDDARQPRLFD